MDRELNISDGNSIVLDESPAISEASMLYETLKCLLATDQDALVDASKVKSIDTASMQVLAAFARHFDNSENVLNWASVSDSFRKTAKLLDLDKVLGCD